MTLAITRRIIMFVILLLLAGCTSLPAFPPIVSSDSDLFARGLDEYMATGELATLERVSQDYPQGEWAPRAEAVIAMIEQQRQVESCMKEQEALEKTLEPLENDLAACRQEKEVLTLDNKSLETTLERLKQVLIDTELQSN